MPSLFEGLCQYAIPSAYDWRLGLDMVELALGSTTAPSLKNDRWKDIVGRAKGSYFAAHGVSSSGEKNGFTYILRHPMWSKEEQEFVPELAAEFVGAQRSGKKPKIKSLFDVVRTAYQL